MYKNGFKSKATWKNEHQNLTTFRIAKVVHMVTTIEGCGINQISVYFSVVFLGELLNSSKLQTVIYEVEDVNIAYA